MSPRAVRAFAPGRVNLIGEHTDYNEGLCLPFAIERGITVTVELAAGSEARAPRMRDDDPFLTGIVTELRAAGVELPGCTVRSESDLPSGVGLSSSAAFCVALALGFRAAAGVEPAEPVEVARLCSRVENEYAGAQTGLLDQLASLLGEEGHAIRLDMRSLDATPVPLELGEHVLAVVDSGAKRKLAASGYNERREECARAEQLLGVESLRDAAGGAGLPEPLNRRVRHVTSENARVDATVQALGEGELEELGRLLDASHASLRDDYEVSVPEVERAVDACKEAGALGARIMGGGFGGSVLALFPPGTRPPEGAIPVSPGPPARLLSAPR